MTASTDNLATPRPRRRRRWLVRIPIIVLATAVTIVVLVQIFLWTDYPRKIAQAQVEGILHVRTTIDRVSIGWMGHTRIEGVALTLPMDREPFLTIAQIDAEHASLPLIAFDQDLSAVSVSGVKLTARQDDAGRWNVQQLLPPSTTRPTTTTRPPSNPLAALPAFRAADVRVSVIKNDGKRLDLPVLEAELRKPDALIATLTARAGDVVSVDGQLAQNASVSQALHATFSHVPADIAAFFGVATPPAVSADVRWDGRLTGTGVAGSLRLVDVRADVVRATGRVDIDFADGRVVARPADLSITIDKGATLDAHTTAGQIAFEKTLTIEGLAGTLNGGRFGIDGTLDPATLQSNITAQWEQVTRDSLATTGSARVRTARLLSGKIQIDVEAKGGVRTAAGDGLGSISISGEGNSPEAFAANLNLDPFTWTPSDGGAPILTPHLAGELALIGNTVRLDARAANDPRVGALTAFAGGDRATKAWWATFDASALRLPELEARGVKGPVDLSLAATGTLTHIDISKAYVKLEKGVAYVAGAYELAAPQHVNAQVWAWYDKPVTEDEAAQLNSLKVVSTISGTVAPRDLKAEVDIDGNELVFAKRAVGDVALHLTAAAGEDEASIRSQELEALGGHWALRGRWSRTEGGPPTIVADFRDIPVANLGAVINRTDLAGEIESGSATLRVRSSRLDQLDMTATAHGSSLTAGPFRAESLDLTASLKAGLFVVKPTLHEDGGTIAAEVRGEVSLVPPVKASITLEDWPAPYVESTAAGAQRFRPRASGKAGAEFSLATGAVTGDVALGGTIERGDTKLADFRVEGAIHDKLITVSKFSLGTLDGTLGATAQLDLGNYNATSVHATFDNLTPARLDWSNPIFAELQGRVNGSINIRPSVVAQALGPVEIELNVRPQDMAFRGVRIDDLDVLSYANIVSPAEFRFVTDHAVLNIAGGRIEPFARLSLEPGRGLAQLVTANFRGLDLGEIVKAADDDGKDIIGKVGGSVRLYGQTTDLKTLTGDATLDISESDLANFGPIAALYNVLSVGTAGSKPDGAGNVSIRVDGDGLTIEDATYFNRGVYANAFGAVKGLSLGTDAEVDHALVVGSLQPLRAVKLPFFGDLNDTLAALQSSVTAIDVTGTVKDPKMQQVSIGALGDTLQKVLLGKMREKK